VANKKLKNSAAAEQAKKLRRELLKSAIRDSKRPKNVRDLGISVVKHLPANIGMVQGLMKAVNFKQAQAEVQQGFNSNVVIVGQPNTGKSTLFNKMKGLQISPVSPEAGTTRTLVKTDFGPFTLIDTPGVDRPGHLSDTIEDGLKQSSVIVFLIDATQGLQAKDRELYDVINKMKKPVILAVNKVDALKGGESGDQLAMEIALLLNAVGVIPISAKTGENIAEELIPAMIEASPEAAFIIGHELPQYRQVAAQRIIRNATLVSLAAGIEPIPLIDIPILLGTQIRLILRLGALYGEPLDSSDAMKHARKLIATMIGGLSLRYLAEQAAKAVPFGGDFVAGAIAGGGTWAIGQVAVEYYEGGKRINPNRMRQLYSDFYHRFRKDHSAEELHQYSIEGNDVVLLPPSNGTSAPVTTVTKEEVL
jgi:small GTP-binding protein